jgi:hypothetical protein
MQAKTKDHLREIGSPIKDLSNLHINSFAKRAFAFPNETITASSPRLTPGLHEREAKMKGKVQTAKDEERKFLRLPLKTDYCNRQ